MLTAPHVRPGGLMRCCTAYAADHNDRVAAGKEPWPTDGDLLECPHCTNIGGGMIFRDGAWEWNHGDR